MKTSEILKLKKDVDELEKFHKEFPLTLEEFKALNPATDADKYAYGFNIAPHYSAVNVHSMSFDTKIGYTGIALCSKMLMLSDGSVKFFWKAFDKYCNLHQKEIFSFIVDRMKETIQEEKGVLEASRDELNDIIASLTTTPSEEANN